MKATVDQSGCISCGLCVGTCPAVFQMDETDRATAICPEIPQDQISSAKAARDVCPVSVISIE